jgi:probable addiction module antidote protein
MALQLTTFDVADYLDSEEAIAEYLSQMMADGDDDELLRALGHVAKARGMSQLAKDAGVGRESLYKALKPGATPGYATVGKVVRALGFRMVVKPAAKPKAAAAAKKPAKPKSSVAVAAAKKTKGVAAGAGRLKGTRVRA